MTDVVELIPPVLRQSPPTPELRLPRHVRDVKSETVRLEPGQTTATLRLQTGPNPGPFNQPVILRASTAAGSRQVGEALLELVAPLK